MIDVIGGIDPEQWGEFMAAQNRQTKALERIAKAQEEANQVARWRWTHWSIGGEVRIVRLCAVCGCAHYLFEHDKWVHIAMSGPGCPRCRPKEGE